MKDFKCPLCKTELVVYAMIPGLAYCKNPKCSLDYLEAHHKSISKIREALGISTSERESK